MYSYIYINIYIERERERDYKKEWMNEYFLVGMQLFEFGDKYRGKYDEEEGSVGVVKKYYASVSGYMDELLWAALWLYKATDREEYLKYVITKAHCFGGIGWAISEFSWDVKYAGLQIIASQVV